ncbi:MAG: serine/arginine repetitive matrix protein 2 [Solirubrobacterales bacterium]|nr:serine/arginine repetitive matrix protein 2 [Solirubrobacterales bacterium]
MMTRPTLTPEERRERLDQAGAKLASAVESITTSDDWQRFLAFSRMLPTYSARNVALLMQQAYERDWTDDAGWPVLGHVAGYLAWQALGRQVRKGERGLCVLAPCKYRTDDETTGETTWRVRGFTLATVFEERQTDGDPLPEPVHAELLTGDGPSGAWEGLAAQVCTLGFTLTRRALAPANGTTDWVTHEVTVADRLDPAAAVKTLAHELAHAKMHGAQVCEYRANRARLECEAESTAFLVMDALGLAADAYSFAYVASWSDGDGKVVAAAADRAITCASEILGALVNAEERELVSA